MAGFREFVTGEVLTAANVDDFLAKQAVMKFADAAARDSALGTAVASGNALREGMVAWLDSDDSVIAYDGSAWNPVGAEPPAGIGSNVVSTLKDDTFTTSSTSFVDVTGFAATITPTSATSKVLVIVDAKIGTEGADYNVVLQLLRDATVALIAPSAGSRVAGFAGFHQNSNFSASPFAANAVYLDSPNTTSATEYKVQMRAPRGSTGSLNSKHPDTNNSSFVRTVSSITLIEVAA
jgi:hypothetical protein